MPGQPQQAREQALHTRVGDAHVMAGQLDRLLTLMSVPAISLGIIPAGGQRHTLAQGSFWMFDDADRRQGFRGEQVIPRIVRQKF
jgi:hypothetical protein